MFGPNTEYFASADDLFSFLLSLFSHQYGSRACLDSSSSRFTWAVPSHLLPPHLSPHSESTFPFVVRSTGNNPLGPPLANYLRIEGCPSPCASSSWSDRPRQALIPDRDHLRALDLLCLDRHLPPRPRPGQFEKAFNHTPSLSVPSPSPSSTSGTSALARGLPGLSSRSQVRPLCNSIDCAQT